MEKGLEQKLQEIQEDRRTLTQTEFKDKYGITRDRLMAAVTTLEKAQPYEYIMVAGSGDIKTEKRRKLEDVSDEELKNSAATLTCNEMKMKYECAVTTIYSELARRGINKKYVSTKSRRLAQITDEELTKYASTLTYKEMARKYGVSSATICRILMKRSITYTASKPLLQVSDQELKDAAEILSMKEMTEYYGVSYSTIRNERIKRGLGRKKMVYSLQIQEKERNRLNTLKDLISQSATQKQIGERLGVSGERTRQLLIKYGIQKPPERMKRREYRNAVYSCICSILEQKLETASQGEKLVCDKRNAYK